MGKREADIMTSKCDWSLELKFDKEQQPYVAKLVQWLVKEDVYDFEFKSELGPYVGCCTLIISTHWMGNLVYLSEKLDKLFPSFDDD